MLGVPRNRMDERVVGLGLAAEQPLRERRPVIRPVRVQRPDDDVIAPACLSIALDELRRSEPSTDDPDHRASSLSISLSLFLHRHQMDFVVPSSRLDDTGDRRRRRAQSKTLERDDRGASR